MTYFNDKAQKMQQGGQAQAQAQAQAILQAVQLLIQEAQNGNEQAAAAVKTIEAAMHATQGGGAQGGAPMARRGSKLDYINHLVKNQSL